MAEESSGDVVVFPLILGVPPLSQMDTVGARQTWAVWPKGSLLGNESTVIW